jgi:5'-3' exonuclease
MCPQLFEVIHISEYHFKRIAIDTSLYLCNYKALYGEEGWLQAFINLVACLRKNEIHCVFIYDSGYPPEKEQEKRERIERKKKTEEKIDLLEHAIEKYHQDGEVTEILADFQNRHKINHKSLLIPEEFVININTIEYIVKKMKKQLFEIKPEDFALTKRVFDILDVPYFNSPLEAETMCSDLCIQGKVDAVLSEDTDVIAYGTPTLLSKINTTDESCIRIRYDNVLKELGFTSEQFLDFCIMCGTDYNKNIFRIGPSKAYTYISDYNSIENFYQETNIDITVLNHERVRQIFREYERSENVIRYCGQPDLSMLQQLLTKKNIVMNIDTLYRAFVRNDRIIILE